jgi:hypothetical protein
VRRRGTVNRKSSKTQRRKPTKPKRSNAARRAPPATSTDATLQEQVSILTRELADAREQLAVALQQQTASSEVLNVISRSPGELQRARTAKWPLYPSVGTSGAPAVFAPLK